MFLEPEVIGGRVRETGVERGERAKALVFSQITIESDRFAEPFYLAMGARADRRHALAG